MSPARGRQVDSPCGGGDEDGLEGDGGWDGGRDGKRRGEARVEGRRQRRAGGRGGGGEDESSRGVGECRPVSRGVTGFPVKTRSCRAETPGAAFFQIDPSGHPWKIASWKITAGKSPGSRREKLLPNFRVSHGCLDQAEQDMLGRIASQSQSWKDVHVCCIMLMQGVLLCFSTELSMYVHFCCNGAIW